MTALIPRRSGELQPVVTPAEVSLPTSGPLLFPDAARSMGIHIMGGKGSGKSILMALGFAWFDFHRGIPTIVFDPIGTVTDYFLGRLLYLSKEDQRALGKRVLYVDMAGANNRVVPFPLYYRLGNESLYEVSQRFLDVVKKTDPYLQIAPLEGWNQVWRTGTYTGQVLSALGYQITEAESLLRHPAHWAAELRQASSQHSELLPAVEFFRGMGQADERLRIRRTETFFTKIAYFALDPIQKAMFGAATPGINWQQVMDQRMMVLLDFRHEHSLEGRRFKMVWALKLLLDFIRRRGPGRFLPISLIVDELTELLAADPVSQNLLAADIDELVNVLARNYRLWVTLAHQELFQVEERLQKTLMSMGTQILGVTSDPDTATNLAHRYFRYQPNWVRKYEPVWMASPHIPGISEYRMPSVVDYRSHEFTLEEQRLLKSYEFTNLRQFEFLVRPALGEGNTQGSLKRVDIASLVEGKYPDAKQVDTARNLLMERDGQNADDLLKEIAARRQSTTTIPEVVAPQPLPSRRSKLPGSAEEDEPFVFGEKATAAQAKTRHA